MSGNVSNLPKAALTLALIFSAAAFSLPAQAAPECGDTAAGFPAWLADFKDEAQSNGISASTVSTALDNASYDESVIAHDRNQRSFQGDVATFAAKRVTPYRVKKGRNMMIAYAEAFERIEKKYGVPAPVLVAIWGLESEFGAGTGGYSTFSALATLAYDCRRADQFHQELMDALRLAQRGSIDPTRLRGAWAGEIGQTQFMPSVYLQYAVSLDGGHPDLIGNPEDALASTANYLREHGWQRGGGWRPGEANYDALLQWNAAPVYARTIVIFADKLDAK
jgi:lytic murein transglycosylase